MFQDDPMEITTERNHFHVLVQNKHRDNRWHPRNSCKHCQMLGRHTWCLLRLWPGEKLFGKFLGYPGDSKNLTLSCYFQVSSQLGFWLFPNRILDSDYQGTYWWWDGFWEPIRSHILLVQFPFHVFGTLLPSTLVLHLGFCDGKRSCCWSPWWCSSVGAICLQDHPKVDWEVDTLKAKPLNSFLRTMGCTENLEISRIVGRFGLKQDINIECDPGLLQVGQAPRLL